MDSITINQSLPCVNDTKQVLFYISSVIVLIGVFGNSLTIGLIMFEKKFHTPTYVTIACLSCSDMMALTFSYLFRFVSPFNMVHSFVISGVAISCLHVSTCHVIMFAILRYLIVAHPLWSRKHVGIKAVLITSLCLWIYGVTYGIIHIRIFKKSNSKAVIVAIDRIFEIVVPLGLILTFHCLKLRHLKRSETRIISIQAKRMFRVISFIACTYFVTMTPIWTLVILRVTKVFDDDVPDYMCFTFAAAIVIYLLNFVIDPFIYFVFSPTFRKQIIRYSKCSNRYMYNTNTSHQSAYTSVSQLQHYSSGD